MVKSVESSLFVRYINVHSKIRRGDTFNNPEKNLNQNVIKVQVAHEDTLVNKEKVRETYKLDETENPEHEKEQGMEQEKKYEESTEEIKKTINETVNNNNNNNTSSTNSHSDIIPEDEMSIKFNLIKQVNLFGINMNIDIFISDNSNIIFFIQNTINIFNPLTKGLRSILTKDECCITCATVVEDFLVVVLYKPEEKSCMQWYDKNEITLKEEIVLDDYDYYENIYMQKETNYFLLITNRRILKVVDPMHKKVFFSVSLQSDYTNLRQYFDFFLFLRKQKLYLWKLEMTYTGLKLRENELKIDEHCKITCFCIYKRNMFIATSNGNIYIWKDLLEKSEIHNEVENEPFHKHSIKFINYYDGYITTMGNESLKLWQCKFHIDHYFPSDLLFILLKQEIKVSMHIDKIITHDSFFLITDKRNCTIYKSKKNNYEDIRVFYNDHNSKIQNLFVEGKNTFSFGMNGKIYDYTEEDGREQNFCLYHFKHSITCSKFLYKQNGFLFFCIGFNNGMIKIIKLHSLYLDIVYCLKASNEPIVKIEKNENCEFIAILSNNEPYVFFLFIYKHEYKPLGYLKIENKVLRNCLYCVKTKAFYIVGEENVLFKIPLQNLEREREKKKEELKREIHIISKNDTKEKENEIKNNDDIKEESTKDRKTKENTYDLNFKYDTILILFDEIPTEEKKYKNSKDYRSSKSFRNFSENNLEQPDEEIISDSESKMGSSGSDLSEGSFNKMSFYTDKIRLSYNTNYNERKEIKEKEKILEIKKKNLHKFVDIIFNERVLKKLEKKNQSYPFLCKAMERKKKISIQNDNYSNMKNKPIHIGCIVKCKGSGFILTTNSNNAYKNKNIFFLDLSTIEEKEDNVFVLFPIVLYEIQNTCSKPTWVIQKMIINEKNALLFCLSNHNEIFVFSTRFLFLYYYIQIPFYERVKNFFIDKRENQQCLYICVHNKYVQWDFCFSYFHFFNLFKRYCISSKKFIHLLVEISTTLNRKKNEQHTHRHSQEEKGTTENDLFDSVFGILLEELHDYMVENFLKNRKRKYIIYPFKFEQIEADIQKQKLSFALEYDEIRKSEQTVEPVKIDNDDEQTEKEKQEVNERKIELLINYDQMGVTDLNYFFNLNKHVHDRDIQFSLRETKEAKKNQEKIRKALLHKKKIYMRIRKLKKKYTELNRRKKFIVDTEYSYHIYHNLKEKLNKTHLIFTYHQNVYNERIRHLTKQYLRLKHSQNALATLDNHTQVTYMKMYLKKKKQVYKTKRKSGKLKKTKKNNKSNDVMVDIIKETEIFEQLKKKNSKLKSVNDDQKIEEISQKKKIIKMYQDVIQKLDNSNEQDQKVSLPKKICNVTEIIRNYGEHRKKIMNQIYFIKESFNKEFTFLKSSILKNFSNLKDKIEKLKEKLQKSLDIEEEFLNSNDSSEVEDYEEINEEKLIRSIEKKRKRQDIKEKKEKLLKYQMVLFDLNLLMEKTAVKSGKIENKNMNHSLFQSIYKSTEKQKEEEEEEEEELIDTLINKLNEEIHILNLKKIHAIRMIKFMTLKIISLTQKNNILSELKKKEKKLRKQKKTYIKEMKNIEHEINIQDQEIKQLMEELEIENKNREELFEKIKVVLGDNRLCYDMLIANLKKNHEDSACNSDNSEESDDKNTTGEGSIIDIYNKEKIELFKKENAVISTNINNIKKNIEHKKSEQRKRTIKKKNTEKEIEVINEEISIIEDDKKNNISEIKFYITLKISKLRNIDYIYDKKKYRLALASKCVTLSLDQYRDIMKKLKTDFRQKEKLLLKYKHLKKENEELENINNKLTKKANDKKGFLKNKLKKYDIKFDFNDLERKFQEKKKNCVLEEEIQIREKEHNYKMDTMNKEIERKNQVLHMVKKQNTQLLEKINEYIKLLKQLKREENPL